MKLLCFGSRSLTARHLDVMRQHIRAVALVVGGYETRFHSSLTLIHGDGPPGKIRNSVGADKLSTVAALLEWPSGWRARTFPPEPMAGETWAAAAGRRNREMVEARPDFALCFHTDLGLGRGSAHTARLLTEAKIRWRLVLLKASGEIIRTEER